MPLEPIHRRVFDEPDRAKVQESVARAVEADPDHFIERYRRFERSLGARYVSADLFKETFETYNASNATRNRYNACVHNAAAVLASEYLRRAIHAQDAPVRDRVILLTGIPGAGKTSSVLEVGEIPANIRVIYEGQLSKPETAISKVQQVLDGGLKPVIVVVHVKPEQALENTLKRFAELGRGAGIGLMASIQGELPDSLEQVRQRFGLGVTLQIADRRVFHEPKRLAGWKHLSVLRSEGHHEHIRHRLTQALDHLRNTGRVQRDAYIQAGGLPARSWDREVDVPSHRGDEAARDGRNRAPENRQEALLTPPAPELTPQKQQQLDRNQSERSPENDLGRESDFGRDLPDDDLSL
jgi:hypothetical protein